MIIRVVDTHGNDFGQWSNFSSFVINIPATIDGLANEQGVQVIVHGKPAFVEDRENDFLTINPSK
jgi:hypothetical protein